MDVIGMADSHLRSCRCAVAKAVAPEAGGKQHELILYTADGASGTLDPAFDAHALPLYMWAMAHWHQWLPLQCLHESIVNAQSKVLDGSTPVWRRVIGPAAAVVASAARIGWSFISGRVACCDDQSIDFLLDPPVVVVQAVRRSVRRWRLKEISKQFPPLVPQAPDVNVAAPHGHLDVTIDFPEAFDALIGTRAKPTCKVLEMWSPKCRGYLRSAMSNGQWTQARLFSVRQSWTDDSRCQLCLNATGTLLHRQVCPAICPHEGWQPPPTQCSKIIATVMSQARRELLATRGLFALRLSVPRPPPGDTFHWILCPPEDGRAQEATWFIDGSLFDEAKRFARRTGFSVVVVSNSGSLLGFGAGVPPHWIVDAAGAELWAFQVVAMLNTVLPQVVTDCKGIVDTLQSSPESACGHKRALARTWAMIAQLLDHEFFEAAAKVRWMPSHTSLRALGQTRDSQGQLVTTIMWRANRLADALAKNAASHDRLPQWVSKLVSNASTWTKHQLALLGVVTHAANNYCVTQLVDGGASKEVIRRDSTAERPTFSKKMPSPAVRSEVEERRLPVASDVTPREWLEEPRPWQAKRACTRAKPQLAVNLARTAKRKATVSAESLKEQADDETRVARWIASRRLNPSADQPAAERMHALRARLRDKLGGSGAFTPRGVT